MKEAEGMIGIGPACRLAGFTAYRRAVRSIRAVYGVALFEINSKSDT